MFFQISICGFVISKTDRENILSAENGKIGFLADGIAFALGMVRNTAFSSWQKISSSAEDFSA